jgi:hypothetical protein
VKPVSRTAYYCCGVRALDAAAPAAFCGDRYPGARGAVRPVGGRSARGGRLGGFRLVARESIIGTAARLGALRIPRWALATVLRSLRDGYTIATFET